MSGIVRGASRYRLDEPVGHGGMATVFRGWDTELGRAVAVKVLADNLAGDESFRKRFLREARLAARLQHPNIVQIFDTGEDQGRPFIVMEFVEGETLAEILERNGRFPPDEAIGLALQMCGALAHAHEAGLVHRDIKPQNLLLRKDGTLKVVDFGIARSARGTRLTEVGSIVGTAAYLAPEQAAGADVSSAADVYALGVVMYELLTGRTPYRYETLTELLVAQNQQAVTPLHRLAAGIEPGLEEVVMRCLARLPEYRPSAAEVAEGLRRTFSGAETETMPTQVLPAARARAGWTTLRRVDRRVLVAGAAVAVALLAALIALASGGTQPAPPPSTETPAVEQARELAAWLREEAG